MRSNDGGRVHNDDIRHPPREPQPAGRQDFFREPVLARVTRQWETVFYHLASLPELAPLAGHPQDLVYHCHIGFDNPGGMTGHRLPIETSDTFRVKMYADAIHKEIPCRSTLLWTIPPTVIQIPLQEAADNDQRPHPEPRRERSCEHLCSDDRYQDRANPDRWIQIMEETMTRDEGSWYRREAQHEECPRSSQG